MNPEANFDILYVISDLELQYDGLLEQEIQNLLYLASLLSLFDGNPHSMWGYSFISVSSLPFSPEIPKQLDIMLRKGFILYELDKYKLEPKGRDLLLKIAKFSYVNLRKKYLESCTDAMLTIPLPLFSNSLSKESLLEDMKKHPRRELLGDGIANNLLYKDFESLKKVLGQAVDDLWIVSTLWIKYLNDKKSKGDIN